MIYEQGQYQQAGLRYVDGLDISARGLGMIEKIRTVTGWLLWVPVLLAAGCNLSSDSDDSNSDTSSTSSDSSSSSTDSSDDVYSGSWNLSTGENSTDDIDGLTFKTINIYLSSSDSLSVESESTDLVVGTASDDVTPVTMDGTTVITISEESYGITIDSSLDDDTLIEYALYDEYDQTVTIFSDSDFKLSLNSITINSGDGPAINIQSDQRAFVELPDDSENTLTDSTTWTDRYLDGGDEMDLKATLFSEGPLIFSGDGSLSITAAKKHAICSDDHVRITEGTFSLTANKKDGIRANDAFILDDGDVSIATSKGKGIKVEGKEDDTAPIGFIAINDGTLNIDSYDKAITAAWEGDEDGDTETSDDDPDPRVTINGGTITITTTETPTDDLSPEGIEAKSVLTINGGTLNIQTTDDALNAGTSLIINDGYIYAVASDNDAIDSNGTLTINGGIIVANGAGNAEGGLDCDENTFTITGGTFIGFGGRNSSPTSSVTTQNTVSLSSITSGLLVIKDSSGNVAFAYTMPESASDVLLSSADLETDTTYTVYKGGSIGSYSELFHGLYLDPNSYTSGSSTGSSFTISSTVTTVH